MGPLWLIRMAAWARHPPSMGRVVLVLVVVGLGLILVAVEQVWGWPEWLRVNRPLGVRKP